MPEAHQKNTPSLTGEFIMRLFSLSVHSRDNISVREVESLEGMMTRPTPFSPVFAGALTHLKENYLSHWKSIRNISTHDLWGGLETTLSLLRPTLSETEQDHLKKDMLHFCLETRKSASLLARVTGFQPQLKNVEKIMANLWGNVGSANHAPLAGNKMESLEQEKRTLKGSEQGAAGDFRNPALADDPLVLSGNIWGKQPVTLLCHQIISESHDVKTFKFRGSEPIYFHYKPGQFLTLQLEIGGKKINRSYTISSTPSRPYVISITVKRVPGGLVSNWLHDNLKVGDNLMVRGPNGKFNYIDLPSGKMLMISGGSGITPVMSMTRWLWDIGAEVNMVFFHQAKTQQDLIFLKELEMIASQWTHFDLKLSCSRPDFSQPWGGYTGRLTPEMLTQMAPDFKERTVYTCGPNPFMESVKEILAGLDFPMENYHQESFGAPPKKQRENKMEAPKGQGEGEGGRIPASAKAQVKNTAMAEAVAEGSLGVPTLVEEKTTENFSVVLKKSSQSFSCNQEDFLLDRLEEEGLEMDSSCRAGNCGTCMTQKISGSVEMECEDGLSEEDRENGFILPCVSRPKSDLELNL